MTRGLLVVSGLPGTGKSVLADALGQRLAAVRLSVDDAEEALLVAGLSPDWTTGVAAYEAVGALAAQNLRTGATVVVDAVNDSEPARETWRRAAASAGAEVQFVLTICTDEAEHRRRLAGRTRPYTHVREPTWDDVQRRAAGCESWAGPHAVVDTVHPLSDSVARVLAARARCASPSPVPPISWPPHRSQAPSPLSQPLRRSSWCARPCPPSSRSACCSPSHTGVPLPIAPFSRDRWSVGWA